MRNQLKEDVRDYIWSINNWINPPKEYNSEYLLLIALYSHTRIFSLDLSNIDLDQDLIGVLSKTEKLLDEQIQTNKNEIENIINNLFVSRIKRLKKDIQDIKRMYNYSISYEDENIYKDSLYDICQDFFMEFRELFLARKTIELKKINAKIFLKELKSLETLVKKSFDYFYYIENLLPNIYNREYRMPYWFLKRKPKKDLLPTECPMAKRAIKFAFGELNSANFEKHLHNCKFCQKLVVDIRAAELESKR